MGYEDDTGSATVSAAIFMVCVVAAALLVAGARFGWW